MFWFKKKDRIVLNLTYDVNTHQKNVKITIPKGTGIDIIHDYVKYLTSEFNINIFYELERQLTRNEMLELSNLILKDKEMKDAQEKEEIEMDGPDLDEVVIRPSEVFNNKDNA